MLDLKVLLLFCSNEATVAEDLHDSSAEAGKKTNLFVLWQTLKSDQTAKAASFELQEQM